MSTEHAGRCHDLCHDLSMHAGCRRNLRGLSAGHSPVGSPFPTPSRRRRGTMTFSLFFSSSCLRLSRKESEGTCTPRAPRPSNCGVYGPVRRSRPLMAHESAVVQSLMSQVSRCTPRHGCGVRVCGSCPHLCGTIMGTVRRCSNSSMVALPNAKTSKLYYVLPYVVHRFHRSGLAVAVPAECLAGLLLG